MKKKEQVTNRIDLKNHSLASFRTVLFAMEKMVDNGDTIEFILKKIRTMEEFDKCDEQGQNMLIEFCSITIQQRGNYKQLLIDEIDSYADNNLNKWNMNELCVNELQAISDKISYISEQIKQVDEVLAEYLIQSNN